MFLLLGFLRFCALPLLRLSSRAQARFSISPLTAIHSKSSAPHDAVICRQHHEWPNPDPAHVEALKNALVRCFHCGKAGHALKESTRFQRATTVGAGASLSFQLLSNFYPPPNSAPANSIGVPQGHRIRSCLTRPWRAANVAAALAPASADPTPPTPVIIPPFKAGRNNHIQSDEVRLVKFPHWHIFSVESRKAFSELWMALHTLRPEAQGRLLH
ncbi:hypothetical protein C8R44DRAFT_891793 [Mycena epipterygia]|nr:hypothetical protein C8R44DRAFT_891793 [Mycena epipterygia]